MRTLSKLRLLASLCLVVALTAFASAQTKAPNGNGAEDPVVGLSAQEARTFPDALKALAKAGRCAFVAEGVPLAARLDEGQVKDLTASRLPLSEMASRLAAACDYDIQRRKGVFALKKRYTDPNDLPDVTLEECRQSLRDATRLVKPLVPEEKTPGDILQNVLNGFSPAETERMRSEGIAVARLTPPQRALVERLVLHAYLRSPLAFAEQSLKLLERTEATVFVRKPWSDTVNESDARLAIGFQSPQESFWPTDVVEGSRISVREDQPPGDEPLRAAETLGGVVASLNGKNDAARFQVDSLLADRSVTTAGRGFARAEDIFEALAFMEDLQIVESQGKLTLKRRTVYIAQDFRQIPVTLRRALPSPVLRALHEPPDGQRLKDYSKDRAPAMTREAVRRINHEVEPLLRKDGERVTLAGLSPSARSAFALRAFGEFHLSWIQRQMAVEPPLYLVHFEESVLQLTDNMLTMGPKGQRMLIGFGLARKEDEAAEKAKE